MGSRFIIVNNGMTGSRGHYFETGVSIAREAQKFGYTTAMAVHVTCDPNEIPPGLVVYPVFRIDHWGGKVAAEVPGLYGLRCSSRALRETTMDDVLAGRSSMEEYLLARFEPVPKAHASARLSGYKARIKHVAERILPPVMVGPARWLVRRRHASKPFLRSLVPPLLWDAMRAARLRPPSRHLSAVPTTTAPASPETRIEACLGEALLRSNAPTEVDLWPLFLRDLDRLLCLADAGPGDHVFLPTAHGREAFAIRRLIHEIGEERSPMFHLEFRHPIATLEELDSGEHEQGVLWYTRIHQAFFDACRTYPATTRMRYYTDTSELAVDYSQLAGEEFGILPIPFRMDLIPPSSDEERVTGPITILFLGDVREEKGFHLLPGLVRRLFDDYVKTGKVRFVFQASIHQDEPSRAVRKALKELQQYETRFVEVIGTEGFVAPEKYYELLGSSHLVLLPYLAKNYRSRSSGVLAEAIAAGIPTIVTADTWLSGQQIPGSGETFTDEASLAGAVRAVCDNYREYREHARLGKERWHRWHSPARLLDCLIDREGHSFANAA